MHKPANLESRSTPVLNVSLGSRVEAWMNICVSYIEEKKNRDIDFSEAAAIVSLYLRVRNKLEEIC